MSQASRAWIRRLTLAAMVVLVAVVAVLIGQRFQRLSSPVEEVEGPELEAPVKWGHQAPEHNGLVVAASWLRRS
jgi:hypothetical protein